MSGKTCSRPMWAGAWCVGSSRNWLVLLDINGSPFLLNPSSATFIHFPPFPHTFIHPVEHSYFVQFLQKTFVSKVALMCSTSPLHYTLAILYGCPCKLALCKSNTWVKISDAKSFYSDIVFSNNYLYALAEDGSVDAWDIWQRIPRKILDVKPTIERAEEEDREFPRDNFSTQLYLVISEGDLLLVKRYIGNFVNADGEVLKEEPDTVCLYRTKHFIVYKLDLRKIKWQKIRSLRNKVLFLGANESTSVPSQALSGYEANSIYFTDDRWEEMNLDWSYGGHDWGVFNLQNKSVKLFTPYEIKINSPPIWVVPTTKENSAIDHFGELHVST
ncbi:F-box protein At4g35733-like [Gastrolobium bilobum]|uniref:F-box protein At4g35733-like n=1 Tax=Gastrolobium bilobum TaxID=150636 RepID=UPI002AB327BE|nr:F-box protein At4g35733-like [Gastrolobium bilobum]